MEEQFRVLRKGGVWFGYIVPKYTDNIQKDYNWINDILYRPPNKNKSTGLRYVDIKNTFEKNQKNK